MKTPDDVLSFWFGGTLPPPSDRVKFWFQKSDDTDREIREQFGDTVQAAVAGSLDEWADDARSRLALVIVLDQFTRNIYRGTPRAFGGDVIACSIALDAIERGFDRELHVDEAFFLYMPLEHQEDIHLQNRCVELMEGLRDRAPGDESDRFDQFVQYAEAHRDVIADFGRFPHRNAILNRPSTPEEVEYLSKPGAGF